MLAIFYIYQYLYFFKIKFNFYYNILFNIYEFIENKLDQECSHLYKYFDIRREKRHEYFASNDIFINSR